MCSRGCSQLPGLGLPRPAGLPDPPVLGLQITTTFPKDPVYTFSISQNPFPIENRDVLGETQVRGNPARRVSCLPRAYGNPRRALKSPLRGSDTFLHGSAGSWLRQWGRGCSSWSCQHRGGLSWFEAAAAAPCSEEPSGFSPKSRREGGLCRWGRAGECGCSVAALILVPEDILGSTAENEERRGRKGLLCPHPPPLCRDWDLS